MQFVWFAKRFCFHFSKLHSSGGLWKGYETSFHCFPLFYSLTYTFHPQSGSIPALLLYSVLHNILKGKGSVFAIKFSFLKFSTQTCGSFNESLNDKLCLLILWDSLLVQLLTFQVFWFSFAVWEQFFLKVIWYLF